MSGKMSVTVVGRLARDPETRVTSAGKNVCTFSLPIQERKDDETQWVKCVAWERQGEVIQQYATKGSWLQVSGPIKIEKWEDKDGNTRAELSVTVRDFAFCGGADAQQSSDDAPAKPAPKPAAKRNAPQPIEDDSLLPF